MAWTPEGIEAPPVELAGEPVLFYQPVIDLLSGGLLGFEIQIGWNHPSKGPIPPKSFMPWAEDNGVIVAVGAWSLFGGCREACTWPTSVQVLINSSPRQYRHGGVADAVQGALDTSGLPPDRLTLEVEEETLFSAGAELEKIVGLGVQLSVSRVGANWRNFEEFERLFVNTVKIERSYVAGLGSSAIGMNRTMIEMVISQAHKFGLAVVAEGVETMIQARMVRELEIDAGLGGFFAPPLDPKRAGAIAQTTNYVFSLTGEDSPGPARGGQPASLQSSPGDVEAKVEPFLEGGKLHGEKEDLVQAEANESEEGSAGPVKKAAKKTTKKAVGKKAGGATKKARAPKKSPD